MMNRLRAFLAGRNGIDHLGVTLVILALGLQAVAVITGTEWFGLLGTILLVGACFRMLSRDMVKRRQENDRFTHAWSHAKAGLADWRSRRWESKQYRFFTCPSCKNKLRVPRGKGKLQITCPRCGQRFSGKT